MKYVVLALAMFVSAGAYAAGDDSGINCGGRMGPCPSTAPGWDGTYAPGYNGNAPAQPNLDPVHGGRQGSNGNNAPGYTGCVEGATAVVYMQGDYQGRGREAGPVEFVCHNNEWMPAN
jgi:hypothetical protein